jgi:hypothetical protein
VNRSTRLFCPGFLSLFLPVVGSLLVLLPLQAQLTWTPAVIDTEVQSRIGRAEVNYAFLNETKNPILITGVVTCCNCVEVDRPTAAIAPGEKGLLPVRYTAEGRTGLQEKSIEVLTSPPGPQRQTLTLRVQVDDPLYVDQEHVFWSPQRPPAPRTVRLRIRDPEALQMIGVQSGDPRIKLRLLEVEPGEVYHLEVTPTRSDQLFLTEITITARYKDGKPVRVLLPAGVK